MQINTPKRRGGRLSPLARPRAMAKISKARRRGPTFTGFAPIAKRAKAMAVAAARREYARPGKLTLTATQRVWRDMEPPEEIDIQSSKNRKTSIGRIASPNSEVFADGGGRLSRNGIGPIMLPTRTYETTTKRTISGAYEGATPGRNYKTVFETGKPSSVSINRRGLLNGTSEEGIRNTLFDSANEMGSADRPWQAISAGFNQKGIAIYPDAHVKNSDFNSMYKLSELSYPTDKFQRIYGLTKYVWSSFRIYNANAFFASNVKIKLYRPLTEDAWPSQALEKAGPTSVAFENDTQGSGIPLKYVLGPVVQTTENETMLVDLKASLSDSPAFSNDFGYVKTFSKKLKPGETWDFKYIHHLGSGVRLDLLKEEHTYNSAGMGGYLMVIEHHGTNCEASSLNNTQESVIGTSPSYLQVEYANGHCSVLESSPLYGLTTKPGGIIVGHGHYAIKVYSEKDPGLLQRRRINFGIEEIGVRGDTYDADGKKVFIPVMTDLRLAYASKLENVPDEGTEPVTIDVHVN